MARLVVHLRDAMTGSPIAFTAIFVGPASAVSGLNGDATFELNPGSYSISVKSPMYAIAPGSPTSVNIPGEITIQMARVTL